MKTKPERLKSNVKKPHRVHCHICARQITLHSDGTFHRHGAVGKHCPMSNSTLWDGLPQKPGTARTVLHGYLVPAFTWDHNTPARLFMPTLTRESVGPCDKKCTVTIELEQ